MVTYNHEPYIRQAVESVLSQQVNFDYELVIGEDCSTDQTRHILIELQAAHPDIIRLHLHHKNVGALKNYGQTLASCKGQYVALLDGDDFWTSNEKLQKQVDFLDAHAECAICFHNAAYFNVTGVRALGVAITWPQPERSTIFDLLERNFIQSSTVMFRRGLFAEVPDWFYDLPIGDWPLHILNARHGEIGYLNQIMSAYRQNPHGVWNSLSYISILQSLIITCIILKNHLEPEYTPPLTQRIERLQEKLATAVVEQALERYLITGTLYQTKELFHEWPQALPLSYFWKHRLWTRIYRGLVFKLYKAGNFKEARFFWTRLVLLNPLCLNNRGLLSIGLEIFLGSSLAKWLRQRDGLS